MSHAAPSPEPKTVVVTGGARGFGLEITNALLEHTDHRIVVGVRSPERYAETWRDQPRVELRALDLSSFRSVLSFATAIDGPIAALINNAGLQNVTKCVITSDGIEETLQVNHLAALALADLLAPQLRGGRVVFVGSGTHDATNPTARIFGFKGEQYEDLESSVAGRDAARSAQRAGLNRYATSKFLVTAAAVAMARERDRSGVTVSVLDPGLMPGTGLVGSAPAYARLLWKYVLPAIALVLPDSSNPRKSAQAMLWLLDALPSEQANGLVASYDKNPAKYVSPRVRDEALADAILEESRRIIAEHLPAAS